MSEDLFSESPFSLSGGQMRRVAISGILASDPDVLIFDEPTVGLDPKGKMELLDLLKVLNEEYHKTIIFITHDMEIVAKVSKRVLVLDKGQIVFDGTKDELFRNSEIVENHSLSLPSMVRIMMEIKDKLNIDIDVYKYDENSAYEELRRVLGDGNE